MNRLTVIFFSLLLTSAVAAGSTNAVRRPNPYSSGTDSSEEYNRYSSGSKYQQGKSFNQRVPYINIPSTFDARDQWSHCPSVSVVPYQGCCDSSYALIPTAVMTDRNCIVSNSSTFSYSAFHVLTCCTECAIYPKDSCRGGDPVAVWKYWSRVGITTEDCLPYSFATTCFHVDCPLHCTPGVSGTVASNKQEGLDYYAVQPTEQQIQAEIFVNGPVEASFDMYTDFVTFRGEGVYIHSYGPYLTKHSVKIIGWGTNGTTPYWLVVNTFGEGWGDKGVAKFLRGQNHMSIETNVHAAKPNY